MFGGAPTMLPPNVMPMQMMPVQMPQPWPPQTAAPPMPPPANWTAAPVVRGQMGHDEPLALPAPPPPAAPVMAPPLRLPTPEDAGVAAPRLVLLVDWNAIRERLLQLGGTVTPPVQLPEGGFRVVFMMSTSQANCYHHIEATAATEAEAVRAALARAEEWASGR
jgi:hypothetical protein